MNVNDVADPNAVPATVGPVTGPVEDAAPENVSDLAPVYEETVLPPASFAVTVIVCESPAVCEEAPVTTKVVALPAAEGVIDADVTDARFEDANVRV